MSRQSQVIDYLKSDNVESIEPLYFVEEMEDDNCNYIWEERKIPEKWKKLDLCDLIFKILEHSETCCSTYKSCTEDYETDADTFRSSLDIWRHVIYIKPEITIFQVMSAIWERREELAGQYCYEIYRRVFKKCTWGTIDDEYEEDEYGLTFEQWKDIDKEIQPEDYSKAYSQLKNYNDNRVVCEGNVISIELSFGTIYLNKDGTYTLEK